MHTKNQISLTRKTMEGTMLLKREATLRLILITIIVILFLGNSFPVSATTPVDPAYGVEKPENFIIRLPYAAGVSHTIGWGYGKCTSLPPYPSLGDHCNNPTGSKDYYALDFDLALNESVYAIAPGKVIFAGRATNGWSTYGNIVFIDHNINGVHYQSLYAHLSDSGLVGTGQDIDTTYMNTTPIGKQVILALLEKFIFILQFILVLECVAYHSIQVVLVGLVHMTVKQ